MKYQIIARSFADHAEAILYAGEHLCVTVRGQVAIKRVDPLEMDTSVTAVVSWDVFELVPVMAA